MNNALATTSATGPLQLNSFGEILSLSDELAKSGLFDDARSAGKALVKILFGRELGFSAIASMTGIHVIEGKPVLGSHLMAAAIRRSGVYDFEIVHRNAAGEEVSADTPGAIQQHTDRVCEVAFKRLVGKDKWQRLGVERLTIEEAVAKKWTVSKSGTPLPTWLKTPKNMLFARCMSNGFKFHTPDLVGSLVFYAEGELEETERAPRLDARPPDVQDAGYTIHRPDGSSVIVSDDSRQPVEVPAPEGNGHVSAPPAGVPDPNVPSPAPARGPEHGLTEEEVAGLTTLAREHRRTHGDVKAILSAVGCLTLGAIPRDRLEWVKQALTVGLTPAAVVDRIATLVTTLNLNWEAFRARLSVKYGVLSIAHLLPAEAAEIEQTLLSRQKLAQQQAAAAPAPAA